MHAGQRAVERQERKQKKYRARLFYTLHDFEAIFLFSLHDSSSSLFPFLHFLFRFQCVGYLSGSYLRGCNIGLTRRWRQTYNTTKWKYFNVDEKSIRFLGCPITETAEIITNGTVDILNNFTLDIEQSYPPVLFCRLEHCFLLPFMPEIEVLFTRSLTDVPWIFLLHPLFRIVPRRKRQHNQAEREREKERKQPETEKSYREDELIFFFFFRRR